MIAMKDDEECLEMAFEQYTLPDHKSQPTSETGHTKNYGAKSSKISSDASFRLFLLVTLSALHSLVVLTLRYTRAVFHRDCRRIFGDKRTFATIHPRKYHRTPLRFLACHNSFLNLLTSKLSSLCRNFQLNSSNIRSDFSVQVAHDCRSECSNAATKIFSQAMGMPCDSSGWGVRRGVGGSRRKQGWWWQKSKRERRGQLRKPLFGTHCYHSCVPMLGIWGSLFRKGFEAPNQRRGTIQGSCIDVDAEYANGFLFCVFCLAQHDARVR
mmetsp:Transcript_25845/g.51459  ORF Transcript_25845/g.51459 Transcript_25845/m.51459 type:complete len:268 (-) Transcript_25845:520-1323(-)